MRVLLSLNKVNQTLLVFKDILFRQHSLFWYHISRIQREPIAQEIWILDKIWDIRLLMNHSKEDLKVELVGVKLRFLKDLKLLKFKQNLEDWITKLMS